MYMLHKKEILAIETFPRVIDFNRLPLWSSGQSSLLQIQRSRFRFPSLLDFLRTTGFGTGSTQPRDVKWAAI
jgi:hypothetical protein